MPRGYKRLIRRDRIRIKELIIKGLSAHEIATDMGVHVATIYRELKRGGGIVANGFEDYSPELGEEKVFGKLNHD